MADPEEPIQFNISITKRLAYARPTHDMPETYPRPTGRIRSYFTPEAGETRRPSPSLSVNRYGEGPSLAGSRLLGEETKVSGEAIDENDVYAGMKADVTGYATSSESAQSDHSDRSVVPSEDVGKDSSFCPFPDPPKSSAPLPIDKEPPTMRLVMECYERHHAELEASGIWRNLSEQGTYRLAYQMVGGIQTVAQRLSYIVSEPLRVPRHELAALAYAQMALDVIARSLSGNEKYRSAEDPDTQSIVEECAHWEDLCRDANFRHYVRHDPLMRSRRTDDRHWLNQAFSAVPPME